MWEILSQLSCRILFQTVNRALVALEISSQPLPEIKKGYSAEKVQCTNIMVICTLMYKDIRS